MSNIIREDDNIQQLLLKAGVTLPHVNNRRLNVDVIDWGYIKQLLSHDATDVTKANIEIQKELAKALLFIAEEVKNGKLQYDAEDVQKIYDTFRNHIQRSYQIGIAYANNIFKTKGFIDSEDLKIIKFLSEYYTQVFVSKVDDIVNDPKFLLNIDRSILDIDADRIEKSNIFNYMAHAISATFQALQIGTIVKIVVLYNDNSVVKSDSLANASSSLPPTLGFVWTTSLDEKACPICSEFSQISWPVDAWGSIPSIPHGTHPRCRCRILLSAIPSSS